MRLFRRKAEEVEEPVNIASVGKLKILTADDEEDIRVLLKKMLEAEGHQVISAVDGEDALQKLKDEKPDLLILDKKMPKLNGLKVLEKVRQDPSTRNLPVIMLTVDASDKDVYQGYMQGADVYLAKPFKLNNILIGIVMALKKARK
ncbi:MAG TPA: response regulator [bacterium]|uniref:Alkaline phosphatase synthesis transcriptional regulatory protein PhoP n=1 Tax=candidate division TA06 bacterium ADurb.Bin417 TaxID=1852828 RepID=A0A1V5MIA8_UNCT6|nr:MAG: Alkaline phosphatase synthesis transcriptional regulatory protein PhoP [candidate division TA06 bacterium ADurb.Bin417]HNQ34582.1 response regulator [bacterium]HNS48506.1 response regulator [bacterium]